MAGSAKVEVEVAVAVAVAVAVGVVCGASVRGRAPARAGRGEGVAAGERAATGLRAGKEVEVEVGDGMLVVSVVGAVSLLMVVVRSGLTDGLTLLRAAAAEEEEVGGGAALDAATAEAALALVMRALAAAMRYCVEAVVVRLEARWAVRA